MNGQIAMIDMHRLTEQQRVELIGDMALRDGVVQFTVDHDRVEQGKADHYVSKLRERFPTLREALRVQDCPINNMTTVSIVAPKD